MENTTKGTPKNETISDWTNIQKLFHSNSSIRSKKKLPRRYFFCIWFLRHIQFSTGEKKRREEKKREERSKTCSTKMKIAFVIIDTDCRARRRT